MFHQDGEAMIYKTSYWSLNQGVGGSELLILRHIPAEEGHERNFCSGEAEMALQNVGMTRPAPK
jgi:hypothetical protein